MKELILNYIKGWLIDILNCRKNKQLLMQANTQIIKIESTLRVSETKLRLLQDDYKEQSKRIKEIYRMYGGEQKKVRNLSDRALEQFDEIVERPVYKNEAIDQEGLDILNNLIKGKE